MSPVNRRQWMACASGLAALSLHGQAWSEPEKIVLSTSVVAPYTTPDRQGFLDLLVAAVFREMGRQAELLVYPAASERSLINANAGIEDGQALRVAGLEAMYPNLVRVPEPVITNDFVAMSVKHRFVTSDWNSLKPYTVGYLIGWKIFENNVPPGVDRTPVRDAEQLFTLLARDRADVVLYERWQGLAQARSTNLDVRVMEPPLVSTPMYMYLHKKHEALVQPAAQALAKLKRTGEYQRIHNATLRA
ncbi:substrate-binding periplasmic protein [Hydrogenophaga aquatica]